MKKKIKISILMLITLIFLTACGSSNNGNTNPAPPPPPPEPQLFYKTINVKVLEVQQVNGYKNFFTYQVKVRSDEYNLEKSITCYPSDRYNHDFVTGSLHAGSTIPCEMMSKVLNGQVIERWLEHFE